MRVTLDWLRESGVRSVLLDATEDGRPLYAGLGFVPGELSYYAHAPVAALDPSRCDNLRRDCTRVLPRLDVLARIAGLDRQAFGGDRLGLLAIICTRQTPGSTSPRMPMASPADTCSSVIWSPRTLAFASAHSSPRVRRSQPRCSIPPSPKTLRGARNSPWSLETAAPPTCTSQSPALAWSRCASSRRQAHISSWTTSSWNCASRGDDARDELGGCAPRVALRLARADGVLIARRRWMGCGGEKSAF